MICETANQNTRFQFYIRQGTVRCLPYDGRLSAFLLTDSYISDGTNREAIGQGDYPGDRESITTRTTPVNDTDSWLHSQLETISCSEE